MTHEEWEAIRTLAPNKTFKTVRLRNGDSLECGIEVTVRNGVPIAVLTDTHGRKLYFALASIEAVA